MLGIFRLADQLIDGLAGNQLLEQCSSPGTVASLQAFMKMSLRRSLHVEIARGNVYPRGERRAMSRERVGWKV